MKIGIIGGGAAGIVASISASKLGSEVFVLERTGSLLNKFVLSGGGRCNISNENLSEKFYNGGSRNFIRNVLNGFKRDALLALLKEIGSRYIIEKDGRIYTGDAKETAHKLIAYTTSLGTKIIYKAFVEKVEIRDNRFVLYYKNSSQIFDRIIITTGGKSYPETGSDGYGYVIAESLGHQIIHPLPGLIPLNLKPNPFSKLQGITIDAEIILENKTLKINEHQIGRLLFTHSGITGPVVMNISGRYIRISREKDTNVYINFLPQFTKAQVEEIFQQEILSSGKKKVLNLIKRFLPDRLAERILAVSNISFDRTLAELKREERKNLIENLSHHKINIAGSKGFNSAHVTTGGVSLDDVRSNTMESRIVKGLYFAGEILDVDGLEGGYNLHWAFATGFIAGNNAARS